MKYGLKILLAGGHYLMSEYETYEDAIEQHEALKQLLIQNREQIFSTKEYTFLVSYVVGLEVVKINPLEKSHSEYMKKVSDLIDMQMEREKRKEEDGFE